MGFTASSELRFSGTKALKFMKGLRIENEPKPIAIMMAKCLKDQGLPHNNEQILVWCQHDDTRRRRHNRMPQKDFGSSAIESRLQTYTKNWYKEHVEWLNNPYTKPKTDPLGV